MACQKSNQGNRDLLTDWLRGRLVDWFWQAYLYPWKPIKQIGNYISVWNFFLRVPLLQHQIPNHEMAITSCSRHQLCRHRHIYVRVKHQTHSFREISARPVAPLLWPFHLTHRVPTISLGTAETPQRKICCQEWLDTGSQRAEATRWPSCITWCKTPPSLPWRVQKRRIVPRTSSTGSQCPVY